MQPTGLVIEDVDGAALVAAGGVLAVEAEVDTQAEATGGAGARGLVLLDFGSGAAGGHVPDVDAAVIRGGGEEAPVFAERHGPDLSGGVLFPTGSAAAATIATTP